MAQVIEINRIEDLHSYRMAWNALFAETPRASFFHSFDWLLTYWQHAAPSTHFRILVIRAGDSITGIVPLCVVHERHRLQTLRVLTYPLSDWGTCYGPIGPNQSASLFMAMRYLRCTPRDWDLIDLRWTVRETLADEATGRAMRAAGWVPRRAEYASTSMVDFRTLSWEEYLTALPIKTRSELLRQRRRLADAGHVEFVRHRPGPASTGDGDPNWPLFEECVEVSRQSWQSQARQGNTLCHNSVAGFVRECHAAAARLGMLDIAVLKLQGRVVAFQYNYVFGGRIQGLRMGHLPEVRRLGAGTVLLSCTLEDSFDRQDESLDLGAGDYEFKRKFRTSTRSTWHYTYCPWTAWKSHSVNISRWVRVRMFGHSDPQPDKAATA